MGSEAAPRLHKRNSSNKHIIGGFIAHWGQKNTQDKIFQAKAETKTGKSGKDWTERKGKLKSNQWYEHSTKKETPQDPLEKVRKPTESPKSRQVQWSPAMQPGRGPEQLPQTDWGLSKGSLGIKDNRDSDGDN